MVPQLMVANCPRCGKVYQKNNRNMCSECSGELDNAFNRCVEFLRKNYRSTCEQVSDATGASSEQLLGWIKEGKLLISDYPNLNYPCATCSKPIRQHKMCPDCLSKLNHEVQKLNDEHEKKLQRWDRSSHQPEGGFQIRDRFGRRV